MERDSEYDYDKQQSKGKEKMHEDDIDDKQERKQTVEG